MKFSSMSRPSLCARMMAVISSCPHMLETVAFRTKSIYLTERIFRRHLVSNLALMRLFIVLVSAPYGRTASTQVEYMWNFMVTPRLRCLQTSSKAIIMKATSRSYVSITLHQYASGSTAIRPCRRDYKGNVEL